MFVPRAVRLKGIKEPQKASKTRAEPPKQEADIEGVTAALKITSTFHTSPQPEHIDSQKAFTGPRFTAPKVDEDYLEKLLCGIQLLFTDYAHQCEDGKRWLETHYRVVDGEDQCRPHVPHLRTHTSNCASVDIHLSAILKHPNISTLKPEATQPLLRRAIESQDSTTLELAPNGYLVRRRPSTYPFSFVPTNSFEVVDDDGLSFWDQRTIYVEPHTRDLCKTPARVAQWLKKHGQMKEKWFPIQAVHTLFNSCAFVVLSGKVVHEEVWRKWRELDRPECWKIMTKVEHTKRTNEYLGLLKKEIPGFKTKEVEQKRAEKSSKPAKPHGMTAEEPAQTSPPAPAETGKKKRKRNKNKGGNLVNQPDTVDEELDLEPPSKKAKV